MEQLSTERVPRPACEASLIATQHVQPLTTDRYGSTSEGACQRTSNGPLPSVGVQHFHCSQSVTTILVPSGDDEGVATAHGCSEVTLGWHCREVRQPFFPPPLPHEAEEGVGGPV